MDELMQGVALLSRFTRDVKALYAQQDELLRKHPHKWAFMLDGRLIIADSLDQGIEILGDDSPNAAHLYLNPNPRKLILTNGKKPRWTNISLAPCF